MQTKNIKMSAIFASGLCSHVRQIQTVLFKRKQKNFFFFFFLRFAYACVFNVYTHLHLRVRLRFHRTCKPENLCRITKDRWSRYSDDGLKGFQVRKRYTRGGFKTTSAKKSRKWSVIRNY